MLIESVWRREMSVCEMQLSSWNTDASWCLARNKPSHDASVLWNIKSYIHTQKLCGATFAFLLLFLWILNIIALCFILGHATVLFKYIRQIWVNLILTVISAFKAVKPLGKDVVSIPTNKILAFPLGYMQTEERFNLQSYTRLHRL